MKQSILDLATAADIAALDLQKIGILKLRLFANADALEEHAELVQRLKGGEESVHAWQACVHAASAYLRQHKEAALHAIRDFFFVDKDGHAHLRTLNFLKIMIADVEERRRKAAKAERAQIRKLLDWNPATNAKEIGQLANGLLGALANDDYDKDRFVNGLEAIRELAAEIAAN